MQQDLKQAKILTTDKKRTSTHLSRAAKEKEREKKILLLEREGA